MRQHSSDIENIFKVRREMSPFFTHLGEEEYQLINSISKISEVIQDHLQQQRLDEANECLKQRGVMLQQLAEHAHGGSREPAGPDHASEAKSKFQTISEVNRTLMQVISLEQNRVRELIHNVQNEKLLQVYKR
jgi:hypothetical protein